MPGVIPTIRHSTNPIQMLDLEIYFVHRSNRLSVSSSVLFICLSATVEQTAVAFSPAQ